MVTTFTEKEKKVIMRMFTDKMDAIELSVMRHLNAFMSCPPSLEDIRLEAVNADFTD